MKLTLFRSVKFNIGLFLAIVAAAAVGSLLPQSPDAPERVDVFLRVNPAWGHAFKTLGLFNVYESWWFIGMLGLMAFDIVVCKLWKRPPDKELVSLPPEFDPSAIEEKLSTMEGAIRQKPMVAEFIVAGAPKPTMDRVRASAMRMGYRLHPVVGDPEEHSAVVATRHQAQRWGSYLAHVALVVILGGGLLKQVFGFVEMVPVIEGRSGQIRNRPGWELFVDKFTVKYYDGTFDPKLFSSRIRVTDHGRLIGEKLIVVNDPLDIHGTRFYQAGWGAGGMFRSVTLRVGKGKEILAPQRAAMRIPGTPIRFAADMLLPDFVVTPKGRADTESLDLRNPAVRFRFDLGGKGTRLLWLLQNEPTVAFLEDDEGMLSRAPNPPMQLAGVDPVLFSGIQVAYDPGYIWVVGGAVAWLVGMVLLFYMHRRQLWVFVTPAAGISAAEGKEHNLSRGAGRMIAPGAPGGDGGARILVGAWSSRGTIGFQKEFDTLMARLRGEFAGVREIGLRHRKPESGRNLEVKP